MKFVIYNPETGEITTYINDATISDISELPNTKELTNEEWENRHYIQLDLATMGIVSYTPPKLLADVKTRKELEIRNAADAYLEQIVTPYHPKERETWHRQVAESEAYLADSNAPTPMIDAIVAQRGNTKLDQATRISNNRLAFETAVGTVLGRQQNRLDLIAMATTVEEFEAITW